MTEFNDNPSKLSFPSQRTVKKETDNRNEQHSARFRIQTKARFEDPRLSKIYTINLGCTEG